MTTECPTCGASLGEGAAFCGRCGARVPRASVEDTLPTQPAWSPAMCGKCASPLARDDRFCARCGAPKPSTGDPPPGSAAPVPPAGAAPSSARASADPPPSPATPVPAAAAGPTASGPDEEPPTRPAGGPWGRGRVGLAAVLAFAAAVGIAAAVYFGFFYGSRGADDTIAALTQVLAPVVAAQRDTNAAVRSLAASDESFAAARDSAARLAAAVDDALAAARKVAADGDDERAMRAACRTALEAHAEYAASLTSLPAAAVRYTTADADLTVRRSNHSAEAYDDLYDLAVELPLVRFPEAVRERVRAVARESASAADAQASLLSFLDAVEALFPISRSERRDGERTLEQLESLVIPPDNAAGRMESVAAGLRGALARIEALTPPDDDRAKRIQAAYREAVQHSVTAADEYAKWMWTLHDYYSVSGDWPPQFGIEADTYLDPSYEAAYEAVELAASARARLAADVDSLSAAVGEAGQYSAADM